MTPTPGTPIGIGAGLLGLDRAEEAEKYAQGAVKLQPDNALLRLLLADIHIALGNDPALLDDFNAYLKLAPNGSFAERVRQHRDQLQQRLQNAQASPSDSSSPEPLRRAGQSLSLPTVRFGVVVVVECHGNKFARPSKLGLAVILSGASHMCCLGMVSLRFPRLRGKTLQVFAVTAMRLA